MIRTNRRPLGRPDRRRRILTPLFLLTATGLLAQPTIPAITLNAGDQLVIDATFPITDAGPGGANVTWDFAAPGFSGTEWPYTAMTAASTPYAADFPGATMAIFAETDLGFDLYSFLSLAGGFTEHGEMLLEGSDEYPGINSDPLTFFTTPLTTTSSGSDTYASVDDFTGGGLTTTTGTHSWTVDGHGTLILPNATYTDVLRIHAVQEETLSLDVGGTTIEFEGSREEWWWVKSGIPFPLLVFSLETDEFGTEIGATAAMVSFSSATSIAEQAELPLRIHPNPAHDAVSLELEASGTVRYRLLDAVGRQVLQGQLATGATSRHILDVAVLNPGLYHLEVRSADGIGTARLIIE